MEEQKLIKRRKKALNGSNKGILAEACNDLATFYYKNARYNDALDEYKYEASIYMEMGLQLEWATANRMISEMYMLMSEYDQALKYEEKHLAVAKELNDTVEEQRAMATLGRIYLLQGQHFSNEVEAGKSLKAAEKAFMKSLVLCERLKGKVNTRELMDMRARLLLNIGVVQEYLGILDKAIDFMQKAASICANQELYDVLNQCLITEGLLHANKQKDYSRALCCYNKALDVASRLEDKISKQSEALASKADVLTKMSDYHSAKHVLLKAWKLNTPNMEEKESIEKKLKIVAAICYTEDLLISTDPADHNAFKKLYEKMGDGSCLLENYTSAVEFYLKMLDHAEKAGDCGKELIPIYVSLSQTYKDLGEYNEALKYYEKEFELIKDIPKEAYMTLINIAEGLYLAKKPYEMVEEACLKARKEACKRGDKKYEIRVLNHLLKYQLTYDEIEKMDDIKAELRLLGCFDVDNYESDAEDCSNEEKQTPEQNTPNIGDDICIDDITDVSDQDEDSEKITKKRTRGRGFNVKKNMKGETQLHLACISGNKILVERLLGTGHPVNVRDNAGWLPIHEACIHGHLEIAEMLIKQGGLINDRGGVKCDGISPIYDAASNGHLTLVKLLLDKGAIPSLKTDFGETTLDALQKWRTSTILDKDEQVLYQNICNRIHSYVDKTSLVEEAFARSPLKDPKGISPPGSSKSPKGLNQFDKDATTPVFKNRNILIDSDEEDNYLRDTVKKNLEKVSNMDDSSNSSIEIFSKSVNNENKRKGVKEYKNAIKALRNRNAPDDIFDHKFKPLDIEKKIALMDPEEVDDDWLDDDIGTKLKKRKRTDTDIENTKIRKSSDAIVKKYPSIESLQNDNKSMDKFNKSNSDRSSNQSRNRYSDLIDSDSSSDSDSSKMRENINPRPNFISKNHISVFDNTTNNLTLLNDTCSRKKMKKRWKKQTTLLKIGFRRNKSPENISNDSGSSNYNSDCEMPFVNITGQTRKAISKTFHKNKSDENKAPHTNISVVAKVPSVNNSLFQTLGGPVIPGGGITAPVIPPAAVRVKVEDKTLLIPLKMNVIHNQSISWLVEEVKSRYYKLSGIRPVFSLMTADGAILSEEDPLSLVLSSPELKTCVTNWKASPAEERYIECCDALNIAVSEEIQQAIGRSHTTHRLTLGTKTLSSTQMRPLFRALMHQSQLTTIILSDNSLGDDGIKFLTDCLPTLKQINILDLSNDSITAEGTKLLLTMFEKSIRPICQTLEHLNVSGNAIGNEGFRHILGMTNYIQLKNLKMNNCSITEHVLTEIKTTRMSLDHIETFEISNNIIRQNVLSCIMNAFNPNLLVDLELENIGVEGNIVGYLSSILETARDMKIKKLSLSSCNLTDAQFMRIYRCLNKAKHLQTISLKNNRLTFISLKKLLQRQPPIPQINLQGCSDIFKYSPDSDFTVWLPAVNFGRCVPEICVTPVSKTDEERESIKLFTKTWLNCFKGRGMVEHGDFNIVKYTCR